MGLVLLGQLKGLPRRAQSVGCTAFRDDGCRISGSSGSIGSDFLPIWLAIFTDADEVASIRKVRELDGVSQRRAKGG